MFTNSGEKIDHLIECFRDHQIPEDLIAKFREHLIINHQGIDGYIATTENYAPVWNEIDNQLSGTNIETLSEEIGIKWHHSPTLY